MRMRVDVLWGCSLFPCCPGAGSTIRHVLELGRLRQLGRRHGNREL